jgi:hypothetical protein
MFRLFEAQAKREKTSGAKPLALVVRAWVLHDGKIERLEFDGLDDDAIAVDLRALLALRTRCYSLNSAAERRSHASLSPGNPNLSHCGSRGKLRT